MGRRPKILMLGDSLTQTSFEGWGGGVANTYQRRADVLNRGMSGYNTRWYLRYAQDNGIWEESSNGDDVVLITIFFGANDASLAEQNPHAHVPLEEYTQNIKEIITKCKEHYSQAKMLCITPPPVHHKQRLEFQKQRYGDKATGVLERTLSNTGSYAKAIIDITTEYKLPCLDLYNTMQQQGDGKADGEKFDFGIYFYDGLHFNKKGHDFVFKSLLELIEKELPTLHVTKDKFTGQWNNSGTSCDGIISSGPYHDSINHASYEEAFDKDSKEKNVGGSSNGVEPESKRARQE